MISAYSLVIVIGWSWLVELSRGCQAAGSAAAPTSAP